MNRISLIAVLALGSFACGGGRERSSLPACDATAPHLCYEIASSEAEARAACTAIGGTFVTGCPVEKATGGCTTKVSASSGQRVDQTKWSYQDSPQDEQITEASCSADGGTYVAP